MCEKVRVLSTDVTAEAAYTSLAKCLEIAAGIDLVSNADGVKASCEVVLQSIYQGDLSVTDSSRGASIVEAFVTVSQQAGLDMHSATFEIQGEVHMLIHANIEFKNLGATYSDIIQHERAETLFGVLHRKVLNVQKRIHEATQKDCGYLDQYVNATALDSALQVLTEHSAVAIEKKDAELVAITKELTTRAGLDEFTFLPTWHADALDFTALAKACKSSIGSSDKYNGMKAQIQKAREASVSLITYEL